MQTDKEKFKIIRNLYWGGGRDGGHTGKQRLFETKGKHYIISQVLLDFGSRDGQYETMIFPATETGQVTNWTESWVHHDDSKLDINGLIGQAVEEKFYARNNNGESNLD